LVPTFSQDANSLRDAKVTITILEGEKCPLTIHVEVRQVRKV
jgi:hypothetical protein